MRILLTGGGTAGHINPALAIAEIVRNNFPSSEILFVGIRGGREEDLVPREGYELRYVNVMGIRRSLSLKNVKALWLAFTSPHAKQTTDILDDFKPDLVIGTGGYACWPIMKAAANRGIPTALHESNAKPGLAVKQLQKHVDRIWINFPQTAEKLKTKKEKILRVGNPLRGGFGEISKEEARRKLGIKREQCFILSFGGSLGAENVNLAVLDLMQDVIAKNQSLLCMHASGKRDYEGTRARFLDMGLESCENCVLTDYIYDMPWRMAAADVIVSRAGAMTLSELSRMGKAAILIPSPYVADNHQLENAKALSDAGAAMLVEEHHLNDGALTEALCSLLESEIERKRMEEQIKTFADPNVNRILRDEIAALLHR